MITKTRIKNIIKNGGATLNKQGNAKNYKSGYQVSKKDCYILNVDNLEQITTAINELLNSMQNDEFCGLWVDNNKIYIDLSIKINNLQKAVNFGKKLKQISIFEWSSKNCIYLKY